MYSNYREFKTYFGTSSSSLVLCREVYIVLHVSFVVRFSCTACVLCRGLLYCMCP